MQTTRTAQVDEHDGKEWLSAAEPGWKWILWSGRSPASVYPPGSTAQFSFTTDASVIPGTVPEAVTTYTPWNGPHFYLSFNGEVIGPSVVGALRAGPGVGVPHASEAQVRERSGVGTIVGPITNPDNGHDYYLLTPSTWTASETEAENLGGTLAVVRNAAENEWIFSKFGYGGAAPRNLWIGLRRESRGGPFAWVTGTSLVYTNWSPGEPDNGTGGIEMYVHMWSSAYSCAGKWNDAGNQLNLQGSAPNGVVEVPRGKSLTEKEKSLLGTWYESGRSDRKCFFAATEGVLFAIDNYGRSTRVICDSPAFILATGWHTRGEILQDKILWSNGSWWSQKASDFTGDAAPSGSEIQLR